jgi:hypothetical protein
MWGERRGIKGARCYGVVPLRLIVCEWRGLSAGVAVVVAFCFFNIIIGGGSEKGLIDSRYDSKINKK